jgi:glycosyltransferase involved in cell wall biosynthesis
VLVLGQHKDTRDLDLLSSLGPVLRSRGLHPRIVGRGWPSVPGWDVDARFVSDEEFEALLRSSAVVLLPYTKVYQSDVAVRAAECAVPVVGGATTNVAQLYGADWCGLVSGTGGRPPEVADWVAALERVLASTESEVQPRVASYHADALTAWERWLAGV